jgi:hypothetical protein
MKCILKLPGNGARDVPARSRFERTVTVRKSQDELSDRSRCEPGRLALRDGSVRMLSWDLELVTCRFCDVWNLELGTFHL